MFLLRYTSNKQISAVTLIIHEAHLILDPFLASKRLTSGYLIVN